MSNALAIAAVTTMLDYLLTQSLASSNAVVSLESVTAKPLDKARGGNESTNQINIFLYQILPNAAWRNRSVPGRVKPGETGRDPLALTLSYLITAYGKNDDDIEGQRLLGMAMQRFHDHPEVKARDIEQAVDSPNLSPDKREILVSSNLKNQLERVRVTPQILSMEEISKMWSTFQAPYRISAAYEVSVVLIESGVPVKAALPVMARGEGDRGVLTQADLTPPFPTLQSLSWPGIREQSGLVVGGALTIKGNRLNDIGDNAFARFKHPQMSRPIEIPLPPSAAPNEITVVLPDETQPSWLAGFYTVALRYGQADSGQADSTQLSNALSVAIAPAINPDTLRVSAIRIALDCKPAVRPGQQVSLLLGSQEIAYKWEADEIEPVSALEFGLKDVAAGEYWLRVRVDGVDSGLVVRSPDGKLRFDPAYRVTVPGGSG